MQGLSLPPALPDHLDPGLCGLNFLGGQHRALSQASGFTAAGSSRSYLYTLISICFKRPKTQQDYYGNIVWLWAPACAYFVNRGYFESKGDPSPGSRFPQLVFEPCHWVVWSWEKSLSRSCGRFPAAKLIIHLLLSQGVVRVSELVIVKHVTVLICKLFCYHSSVLFESALVLGLLTKLNKLFTTCLHFRLFFPCNISLHEMLV